MPTLVEFSPQLYSPAEYLSLEEKSDQRHEYLDGVIVPMTGGSLDYDRGNKFKSYRSIPSSREYWLEVITQWIN